MLNDTSHRSVTTWFRCCGYFDHYFITNLLLSLFSENFKIAQNLPKLWWKFDCLKRYVRRGTKLLKDEELALRWQIWRTTARNCSRNSITLRLMLFAKLDSVFGKYQTGVCEPLVKPWFRVKIKRILVFYINIKPRLKWNKDYFSS